MFTKKILIDLDGVLNEYGKEKFNENYIPEIKKEAYFIHKLLKIKLSINIKVYLYFYLNV